MNEIYLDGVKLVNLTVGVGSYEIVCVECNSKSMIKHLLKRHLSEPYICSSCRNKGKRNPCYGKSYTADQRKQMSKRTSGRNNPMYGKSVYKSWIEKYGKNEADRRQEIANARRSEKMRGKNNPFFGKTHSLTTRNLISDLNKEYWNKLSDIERAERSKLASIAQSKIAKKIGKRQYSAHRKKAGFAGFLSQKRFTQKTRPEKIVYEYLQSLEVDFKWSHIIGKYQYDFLLADNVLIEVQGDYWHSNPALYEDKKPTKAQLANIEKDTIKKSYAEDRGYKIIYLWETDINTGKFKEILNNEIGSNNDNN